MYLESDVAILDILDSKPDFFREFWEIPPPEGEPNCFNHRVSYVLPSNIGLKPKERLRYGFGAALSSEQAVCGCLGEAMERYSGFIRDLKKIRICSWKELGKEALRPDDLAGFSPSQLRSRSFPYPPFTESTKVGWIQGFSLIRKVPVWVPTQHVFLAPYLKKETVVTSRVSTGLACGSSRESAILHGLLEVVERDSFAIMWMNKLSMPLVDLNAKSEVNHPLKQIVEKNLARPHLKYIVIEMTTDLGFPAYSAVAQQTNGTWPNFVLGCSCRLNAADAIESALVDAVTGRCVSIYRSKEFRKFTRSKSDEKVLRKVSTVHDHAKLYTDPRFSHYAEFMWASKKRVPLSSLPNLSQGSVKKDLAFSLSILKKKGYDCIVVDVTPKEVAEYGLTVVKVIIPGAQPLHFGWGSEFLRNRRLYEVPKILGYTKRPTTEKEIYRIPHPMA